MECVFRGRIDRSADGGIPVSRAYPPRFPQAVRHGDGGRRVRSTFRRRPRECLAGLVCRGWRAVPGVVGCRDTLSGSLPVWPCTLERRWSCDLSCWRPVAGHSSCKNAANSSLRAGVVRVGGRLCIRRRNGHSHATLSGTTVCRRKRSRN